MDEHLKILIDAKPKWRGNKRLDDYNANIIRSLTSYPLFKYSEQLDEYLYYAASCYFCTDNYKKHYIRIKNGIKDYSGRSITIEDYLASIQSYWMVSDARYFVNKILKAYISGDWLIIDLKYADPCFYKILSRTDASPEKCGKYYMKYQSGTRIVLELNHFYCDEDSDQLPDVIEFEVDASAESNISKVKSGTVDLTSNMLFLNRFDLSNVYIHMSDVYIEVRFVSSFFKGKHKRNLRKKLVKIIKMINFEKYGGVGESNSTDEVVRNNKKQIDMPFFTIGCTNFYPNVDLTDEIVYKLMQYGIKAEKVMVDYYDKQAECDLMVSVSYLPYHDIMAYYGNSILFSDLESVGRSTVTFFIYRNIYLCFLKYPNNAFWRKILDKIIEYEAVNAFLGFVNSTYIKNKTLREEMTRELFGI